MKKKSGSSLLSVNNRTIQCAVTQGNVLKKKKKGTKCSDPARPCLVV